MQSNEILQARVVADFLLTARRYLNLPPAASAVSSNPFRRLRPALRSLLVAGSLGTALAHPAFAIETLRPPAERETPRNTAKREISAPAGALLASPAEKFSQQ
ncbi:hypothetical protein [Azonexus sp. IMCC34839]|uniref:hypothetical protein n=1 Tax=Azonexus sp. IMCC34839 TaxID=3133695 RepID=UPI003999B0FA